MTLVVKYGNSDSDKKLPGTASLEGTGIATGASESQTINAYSASAAGTSAQQHTYVAIVKPGSRTFVIKVKAGDTGETEKSYTEKAAHTLKAGYNYQYNFTSTNELILERYHRRTIRRDNGDRRGKRHLMKNRYENGYENIYEPTKIQSNEEAGRIASTWRLPSERGYA